MALAGLALVAGVASARGAGARPGDLGASALPVGQVGGVSRVLVPRGDLLWAGLGPRVAAIDARDVAAMKVIGRSSWLDGTVVGLDVDGDLAVANTIDGRLTVLDVSDPTRPRPIRAVALSEQAQVTSGWGDNVHAPVALARGYAYALWSANDAGGPELVSDVAVVDVRSPGAPSVVLPSLIPTGTVAIDLVLLGEVLAVSTAPASWSLHEVREALALWLFDLHDPVAPRRVAVVPDPAWLSLASGPGADGRPLLYGAGWGGIALDVADPARPREVARYGDADGWDYMSDALRLAIGPGGRMFVARPGGFGDGLLVELLRQPLAPDVSNSERWVTAVTGDPAGGFATVAGLPVVAVPGGRILAYSPDGGGDVPRVEPVGALDVPGVVESVVAESTGRWLFATTNQGGLWSLDRDGAPLDPTARGLAWGGSSHNGLAVHAGVAVVGTTGSGDVMHPSCAVFDAHDPEHLAGRASLSGRCGWSGFALADRMLYAGGGDYTAVYDLADLAAPTELGLLRLAGPVASVAADGRRLAIPHFSGGYLGESVGPLRLALFDRIAPGVPTALGDGALQVPAGNDWNQPAIVLTGDLGYLLTSTGSRTEPRHDFLAVLDLGDAANPRTLATLALDAEAYGLVEHRGYVFVGVRNGVRVVDARDPAAPRLAGRLVLPVSADPNAVAVAGQEGLVYVAAGSAGLYVFRPALDWAPEATAVPPPTSTQTPVATTPTGVPTATVVPSTTPSPPPEPTVIFLPYGKC